MTYTILIDQKFAVANNLTITQATTLAACMTLPTWTNTITVDGVVWYQYSEAKMVEDFPLLFSIPKRVYKNIKELADEGYIELSSFGKTKYLRFTAKCRTWNRSDDGPQTTSLESEDRKSENGLQDRKRTTIGPKTDYNWSENGPHNYIINNNNINNNNNNAHDARERKKDLDLSFVLPEFKEVFEDWLEYKKDRKEVYKSEKSFKACYDKLVKLSGNNPGMARQIIEQSMANNWAGLFALKTENDGNNRSNYFKSKREVNNELFEAFARDTERLLRGEDVYGLNISEDERPF